MQGVTQAETASSPSAIRLIYHGRLANNLFQYCFARILSEALQATLIAAPVSGFPGTGGHDLQDRPSTYDRHIRLVQPWRESRLLLEEAGEALFTTFENLIATLRQRSRGSLITIDGIGAFLNIRFYENHRERMREEWLKIPSRREMHPRDLTVHIRSGDIWWNPATQPPHASYCALPFSFYREVITLENWRRIYVVTEDPADLMAMKLAREYGAEIVSHDVFQDFCFLRESTNVVLAVSTFSWLASYLSKADRIYVPLAGLFHSGVRPDIDLHARDPRYRYITISPRGAFGELFQGIYAPGEPAWSGLPQLRQQLLNM
ncbi:MAG: hypothetical protein JO340_21150 [Acidobacteriaceae bacterium]|nr:hypothetical protein [Acidobacteriaceae bacterium]